jgi:antibiotic biosynthesis monooxygenase (ABM) superfamily enzyme
MVLYVMKWTIRPEKVEAYQEWTQSAIRRTIGGPGVVEFRAYRPATGASQVVVTYEFADLADWAAWYASEDVQSIQIELRNFVTGLTNELWGPSPIVPEPVRPGG